MYLPEIGAKIKQLRRQRGLSQLSLAKQLGISKSVISSYENGVHFPPYDVLVQLSRIFSVSTDYLLGAESNHAIHVEGLTDVQVEAINRIVEELKALNQTAAKDHGYGNVPAGNGDGP